MKFISWNCRGQNKHDSPKIPYVKLLNSINQPMFSLLSESKMKYLDALKSCRFSLAPSFVISIDALGSKGGLLVVSWSNLPITCIFVSPNFIVCKVKKITNME